MGHLAGKFPTLYQATFFEYYTLCLNHHSNFYPYVCQAFCSTIAGILTTHAIMKSVGVGDAAATALSATVTWVLKDGIGMIGRIMFAWWKGYVEPK